MQGLLLPGLAMAAHEMPTISGVVALNHPEVCGQPGCGVSYSLEDVALFHVKHIESLVVDHSKPFVVMGMSMGGMITSILASTFRARLPKKSCFAYFVTSPNLKSNPAVPEEVLREWFSVKPGNIDDFKRILLPMFGNKFRSENPERCLQYVRYRCAGENKQNSEAFLRQLKALRSFDGHHYFSNINPQESIFVGGSDDQVLGPKHSSDLRELCPEASHEEIQELGHMINIERPDLIQKVYDGFI